MQAEQKPPKKRKAAQGGERDGGFPVAPGLFPGEASLFLPVSLQGSAPKKLPIQAASNAIDLWTGVASQSELISWPAELLHFGIRSQKDKVIPAGAVRFLREAQNQAEKFQQQNSLTEN